MSIFDLFDKIAKESQPKAELGYLVIGLGNPGMQYENSRHNAGYSAVETVAETCSVKIDKMKFKGLYSDCVIGGKRCILLKPTTYMNLSGESVVQAMNFYKLDTKRLIVMYDDISLEPGKLRIRKKGSHGGHNGIRSIIDLTGTDEFLRIKLGVGNKPHPDYNLADWVLGKFGDEDGVRMKEAYTNAALAVRLIVEDKLDEAMNKYSK